MKNRQGNIYFISDVHLGAPNYQQSLVREKKLVHFLDSISSQISELYIVGDLFDFWFEYKHAIPKGYSRIIGKLANLADNGVKLHIFTGNHDLWMRQYFALELGAIIYTQPIHIELGNKKFYIAHGDGLGPGDHGYKMLKKIFTFKPNKWLYRWLHPDIGIPLASFFSASSRAQNLKTEDEFLGEKEWLIQHARKVLQSQNYDYFIFGHRHYPSEYRLNEESVYYNIGDWISNFSYIEFDGEQCSLKYFN